MNICDLLQFVILPNIIYLYVYNNSIKRKYLFYFYFFNKRKEEKGFYY